ncbi:hypothetical protein COHA_005633 [Chlorella ohadii]|uniref:Uncharacterized protein n=1 Tax=Chlorella ohadii TaxID=2649997 RepID=A0AAD5DPB2_9CHLO|nr:hypothetical protein COHA_005633 [Chlorella ohadii]
MRECIGEGPEAGQAPLPLILHQARKTVAMAGASTSLLFMAEADAALDETNRHLVVRLFDGLSTSSAVPAARFYGGSRGGGGGKPCAAAGHIKKARKG